jgi:hypothetical protein
MNVFISYGSTSDQVTALRLQALGAVNGLTVYVPPAYTRQSAAVLLDPETGQKLREADVVLGVVSTGVSEACRQELNTSRAMSKPTIVVADPVVAAQLEPYFGPNLVVVDPDHPDRTELGIVQHLRAIDTGQQAKNALIALGTLALGLLIFAPQE